MSTELAVQELSREKVELIKQTVAKGANDLELQLFFHACQRTGLDPLMKQIHAIKRWDSKLGREAMTIQTGIDGYRLIAERTGNYAPGPKPTYVMTPDGGLVSATAYVKKRTNDGVWHVVEGEAFYDDYVQTKKDGHITEMWKKGRMMLAKCAEALALRKAFPAELSGLYTHEEMMQADNEPQQHNVIVANKQTAQAKIAELAKEMQEPARQTDLNGSSGDYPASQSATHDDAAAPFIWKMGKWKDTHIADLPLDYLVWACTNISRDDHRLAAADEIDRRQKQDVMAFEGQE